MRFKFPDHLERFANGAYAPRQPQGTNGMRFDSNFLKFQMQVTHLLGAYQLDVVLLSEPLA